MARGQMMVKVGATIVESHVCPRLIGDCEGATWREWDGVFKVETPEGVLYFFHSTMEGGMFGVTKEDLFALGFPSKVDKDTEPAWLEFYWDGLKEGCDRTIESRYYPVFKRIEDLVKSMSRQIDIKNKARASCSKRSSATKSRMRKI